MCDVKTLKLYLQLLPQACCFNRPVKVIETIADISQLTQLQLTINQPLFIFSDSSPILSAIYRYDFQRYLTNLPLLERTLFYFVYINSISHYLKRGYVITNINKSQAYEVFRSREAYCLYVLSDLELLYPPISTDNIISQMNTQIIKILRRYIWRLFSIDFEYYPIDLQILIQFSKSLTQSNLEKLIKPDANGNMHNLAHVAKILSIKGSRYAKEFGLFYLDVILNDPYVPFSDYLRERIDIDALVPDIGLNLRQRILKKAKIIIPDVE